MKWERRGRKRSCFNLRYCTRIRLVKLRKTTQACPGKVSNALSSNWRSESLPLKPTGPLIRGLCRSRSILRVVTYRTWLGM
jgi:hypothetical protein